MKEKLTKLINVKSIVTILLTLVYCYLSIKGEITVDMFDRIFTFLIAFYFGTQHEKKSK